MQLKINSSGGFELLDTDTNQTFEFAGNLAALTSALSSSGLGQEQLNRLQLAGGNVNVDNLNVTGE